MNMAVKKVELIEWLIGLKDENLIRQIESLKTGAIKDIYDRRRPKTMDEIRQKLIRSEQDIQSGQVYSQEEVREYFKDRFNR